MAKAKAKDQWLQRGREIAQGESALQWQWGDWLNEGERQWGDIYTEAEEISGKSNSTLRDYKWVASMFDLSRRRDKLSWGHHAVVAGIQDDEIRTGWLDRAEAEGWPRARLREELRTNLFPTPTHPAGSSDHTPRTYGDSGLTIISSDEVDPARVITDDAHRLHGELDGIAQMLDQDINEWAKSSDEQSYAEMLELIPRIIAWLSNLEGLDHAHRTRGTSGTSEPHSRYH
jgi:hypothetical protein